MEKKNIEWFKKFIDICESNDIWYQVFFGTLIGTIREKGPIKWDHDFDVIMTPKSYQKLKTLYPQHCIDSITNDKYPWMAPKFVPNSIKITDTATFVDIFFIVDSNRKNIRKYTSAKTKFMYSIQVFRSKWKPNRFSLAWFIKYITFPFWFIISKFTTANALDILEDSNSRNIKYVINSPFAEDKGTVFPKISFETDRKKFLHYEVNVPKDYHIILTQEYNDYMIPFDDNDNKIHPKTLFIDHDK